MSYQSMVEMAGSQSLRARVTACAADEGQTDALQWAQANIWKLASAPGWDAAWQSAVESATNEENPDTGIRPGVITDGMILSAVQALRTEQT